MATYETARNRPLSPRTEAGASQHPPLDSLRGVDSDRREPSAGDLTERAVAQHDILACRGRLVADHGCTSAIPVGRAGVAVAVGPWRARG